MHVPLGVTVLLWETVTLKVSDRVGLTVKVGVPLTLDDGVTVAEQDGSKARPAWVQLAGQMQAAQVALEAAPSAPDHVPAGHCVTLMEERGQ